MISRTEWACSEAAILRKLADVQPDSVSTYQSSSSFPTLNISPERYVATQDDDINERDFLIHHAINAAAFAQNSEDQLLQFLVVVVAIHTLGLPCSKEFFLGFLQSSREHRRTSFLPRSALNWQHIL
jgi:hypothetical protein